MYYSINDFVQEWSHEAASTQRLLDVLTDESLSQEVTSVDRTLGRIAWHIVISLHTMGSEAGLTFDAPSHNSVIPATAKEIAFSYRQASDAMIEAVKTQWTDEKLKELQTIYGQEWTNGLFLSVLMHHQTHHRGQMSVLMRQAGLSVPGVYGPAREEWSTMGMEAPYI